MADPTLSPLLADENRRTSVSSAASNAVDPEVMSTPGSGHHRKVTYHDLKRVIEKDDNIQEVTIEQIERVKMMHDKFMDGAVFNFNYNTLLVVASVIAALGLVSNSSATIIASMLVSPLMGPVVAMAYGSTIGDRKMTKLAATNELVSLLFCVSMGALIGACTGLTNLADDWPTDEMRSRTTMSGFYVGIPVAFFSGLGVAVSLLDDQTNSLVGVAISASLLPPAVNCGIIWVMYAFYNNGKLGHAAEGKTLDEFIRAGWVSLGLTLVNILMIWLSSMLMFRLKEVLPIEKKVFWSDLGIARKIYQGRAYLIDENASTWRKQSVDDENPPPPPPNVEDSPLLTSSQLDSILATPLMEDNKID